MKQKYYYIGLILVIIIVLVMPFKSKSQSYYSTPCPLDTIKGIVLYCPDESTHAEPIEGYFIAKCGGYMIGNYYGFDNVPTFIPAYFIRNDEIINGKRQIRKYVRQKNTGVFTDIDFNTIPFESVYGLLIISK